MRGTIVMIGIGEIGGALARGFLRSGHPVVPVNRGDDMNQVAEDYPLPELAVVAVAEKDLHGVLDALPAAWRDRLGLLQNELLPMDWQRHGFAQPTVISVWFEKKPGRDVKPLVPSPIHGPGAATLKAAFDALEIPARIVDSDEELLFELVRKNLYILTTNIAGLVTGGSVAELWRDHRSFAIEVAEDVMDLQASLTGREFDRQALIEAMLLAFDGDPEHRCTGRSAPVRLERALQLADESGLAVPTLRRIQAES